MADGPNWETIQDTLENWFASAIGGSAGYDASANDDVLVSWVHEDAPTPAGFEYYGELNVQSLVGLGRDETRYAPIAGAPAGSDCQPTVYGNRIMTLRCEVVSRPLTFPIGPMSKMERARTSLKWASTREAFISAGIAFIDTPAFFEMADFVAERDQARAIMDVRLAVTSAVDDVPGSFIDTVAISGAVDLDHDGTNEVAIAEQEITQ